MNYSGEAAEQVVRMSLNGIEVAAKISGKAAERLAVLLYAVLRDQKKTRGKTRLTNMLKSGKELKVFAVKDAELLKFCQEAKKYGVLYCVLKDNKAGDGLTDIMVRAEDASKINRIFERFNLATIDMASVKTEIQRGRETSQQSAEEKQAPERTAPVRDPKEVFAEGVVQPEVISPTPEKGQSENPTMARATKSRQSEPSSVPKRDQGEGDPDRSGERSRPSVRQELREIREEQGQTPGIKAPERDAHSEAVHIPVPKKKPQGKEQR